MEVNKFYFLCYVLCDGGEDPRDYFPGVTIPEVFIPNIKGINNGGLVPSLFIPFIK